MGNMTEVVEVNERLIRRLRDDFPQFRLQAGRKFKFRPPRTVIYEESLAEEFFDLQLLHEVGHALLEHRFYTTDLMRLKMERAAWEQARELSAVYGVEYDEDYVESALDSYRDWLHVRSRCTRCGVTRFQDDRGQYHCLECDNFCTKCIKNVDN